VKLLLGKPAGFDFGLHKSVATVTQIIRHDYVTPSQIYATVEEIVEQYVIMFPMKGKR
jgi:hypothetical protein